MPFVEIKPIIKNIVRIKKDGKVFISKDLRDEYFSEGQTIVFIDRDNKLLGLQPCPNDKGYKINPDGSIKCKKLLNVGVKVGEYKAEWNTKHVMIVASIKLNG